MIQRVYNNKTFYTKLRLPLPFSERYLIRWQPKHSTGIHGHDGKKCSFYLLKGSLKEKKYIFKQGLLVGNNNNILNKFLDNEYIDDTIGLHSIHNISDRPSYSYHIYK